MPSTRAVVPCCPATWLRRSRARLSYLRGRALAMPIRGRSCRRRISPPAPQWPCGRSSPSVTWLAHLGDAAWAAPIRLDPRASAAPGPRRARTRPPRWTTPSRSRRRWSRPAPPAPRSRTPTTSSIWKANQLFIAGHGESLADALARIEAPTLIIHQPEDLIFYPALVQQTAELIAADKTPVQRVDIAGARGHWMACSRSGR
jgi:pimeloyl-ACP methyl ester carboxylesterase